MNETTQVLVYSVDNQPHALPLSAVERITCAVEVTPWSTHAWWLMANPQPGIKGDAR